VTKKYADGEKRVNKYTRNIRFAFVARSACL